MAAKKDKCVRVQTYADIVQPIAESVFLQSIKNKNNDFCSDDKHN